jgi:hypothetical protein
MDYSRCVISISFDREFFLVIGRLQPDVSNDKLEELHRDLRYLYPFRVFSEGEKITYENIEDFSYLRKKHNLVGDIVLSKKFYGKKSFHKPILYNYVSGVLERSVSPNAIANVSIKPRTCILIPYTDPVLRARLANIAIKQGFSLYVTTGEVQGDNTVSTATLYTRYLLSRCIPITDIIKVPLDTGLYSIVEALDKLERLNKMNNSIYIACSSQDICNARKMIRTWKRNNVVEKVKFYFICD